MQILKAAGTMLRVVNKLIDFARKAIDVHHDQFIQVSVCHVLDLEALAKRELVALVKLQDVDMLVDASSNFQVIAMWLPPREDG